MFRTRLAVTVLGLLFLSTIAVDVVAWRQVSASNYLVRLEVDNGSPFGCVIHDAFAAVYELRVRCRWSRSSSQRRLVPGGVRCVERGGGGGFEGDGR